MPQSYDYFVIFAEMRTGSNFLEENVNSYSGLKCWGEIYNPHFVGKPSNKDFDGITVDKREADPLKLLEKLKNKSDGLDGFRYFHDHDPRMFDTIINDPRCAKIILTRNPLESYVSRKIAGATGQWRLGDLKDARTAKIKFDPAEFEEMLDAVKAFQKKILRSLQVSGQTAFYISYEDVQDIDVLNGLAKYLGVNELRLKTVQKTKVQNPSGLEDKVVNYPEMVSALSSVDHFNLANTPNFEPRRGPAVPTFVASKAAPILYLPVRGGPEGALKKWLASLGGDQGLIEGFSQKTLRNWKRNNKGHRSFTVVTHPVVRLHRTFCKYIANVTEDTFGEIRDQLRTTYKLSLPADGPNISLETHRESFIKFANFVKGNLGGQTSIRVDGGWASQSEVINGFAEFALPDYVFREDELAQELPRLLGDTKSISTNSVEDAPFALVEIYDADVEAAVRAAYQKDYMIFGFKNWR
ncbi:nodulation protein NodH [Pacificibacter sp. AS14]|uniref:nodulation protein NodH n=1 Tax=Pacificibacter sp. AS14 TaxID=3135785 RepID=UPI00316E93D2